MKKSILTFALIFITGFVIQAQDWSYSLYSTGKKYPGYIIKSNGDKIDGYIKAQKRGSTDGVGHSNQTRVVFYSDPKNKKTKVVYKPKDLKGYMIADKYYKTMNYSGGLLAKPLRFLIQVNEGMLGRFVWYTDNEDWVQGEPRYDEKFIIQKGDNKPIEESNLMLSFVNKFGEMVSDYAELAQKVRNKEKGYGVVNIEKIIEEYNTWYKETHK